MRTKLVLLGWAAAALVVSGVSGCARPVESGPVADHEAALDLRKQLASAESGGAAASDSASADSGAPTGWASLRGAFKYSGPPVDPARLVADKDSEVCGKHPLFDESVVVGPDGGLANVAVYLRTKKPPVHPELESPAQADVVLDNKNCRFEPHVAFLRTSQKLLIKNSDPVGHNSKIDGQVNPSVNVLVPADEASPQTFPQEEPQPMKVGCNIHPWMGAWILVRNDPYAAVSGSDGGFSIEKLPAGKELEFQLWHEKGLNFPGLQVNGVKVDSKGRFKLKLEPDQELVLNFEVPATALK